MFFNREGHHGARIEHYISFEVPEDVKSNVSIFKSIEKVSSLVRTSIVR